MVSQSRSMHRFERFARYTIVSASMVFFLLFGALPYHGVIMNTMDMAMTAHGEMVHTIDTSMPSNCLALCMSANQEYVDGLMQALYVFFSTMTQLLGLVCVITIVYIAFRLIVQSIPSASIQKMYLYLRRHLWSVQFFSPIHELYRTGILAPKLCA